MPRGDLTLFSYTVLGLVGRNGAGPHDLLRMARQGRVLDWAGESQYYVEPKRLAKLGYLEASKAPGKTRERTIYTLTEQGVEALRAWGRTPARLTPIKSEPLIRLLVSDLVGEAQTAESLGALRGDIAEAMERLGDAEAIADTLPHRREALLLAYRHVRRMLELQLAWVDEVEETLG
jgi:PadR family transcriptional regulator, regulatory protein AphA